MQTIKQLWISNQKESYAELRFRILWNKKNQNTHAARFAYRWTKTRGFESESELGDWSLAETEVDEFLNHLSGTG